LVGRLNKDRVARGHSQEGVNRRVGCLTSIKKARVSRTTKPAINNTSACGAGGGQRVLEASLLISSAEIQCPPLVPGCPPPQTYLKLLLANVLVHLN